MAKDSQNKPFKEREYEQLGRLLVSIGETGKFNRFRLYRTSFVKGVFVGLGSVIGATVMVAILLFILSLFSEIPLIGNFIGDLQTTLEETQ